MTTESPTIQTNELVKVVEQSGLEQSTANVLKEKFLPFFEQAEDWKKKAEALVVTDVSQTREMQMARQARLALKDIRVAADKTRKDLKEDSLRYGKAVQGVYNVIEYLIVPIEKHLEEQEKFAETQAAKIREQKQAERSAIANQYSEFIPANMNFGSMSDSDFDKLVTGAKLQQEAKIEAARKAEQERIDREIAEAKAREEMRIENERLKKEAEEKEKALAAERAKAEADRKTAEEKVRIENEKLKAIHDKAVQKLKDEQAAAAKKLKEEQDAKAKLEAELKAKAEAEEKAKKDSEAKLIADEKARQLAAKKAAAAPDKAKLNEWLNKYEAIAFPALKSEDANSIMKSFQLGVDALMEKARKDIFEL